MREKCEKNCTGKASCSIRGTHSKRGRPTILTYRFVTGSMVFGMKLATFIGLWAGALTTRSNGRRTHKMLHIYEARAMKGKAWGGMVVLEAL